MLLHNHYDSGAARQLVLTRGDMASTTIELSTIADTQFPTPASDSLFDVTDSSAATLTLDSNIIWGNDNNSLYSLDNSQVVIAEFNINQYYTAGSNTQSDPLFVSSGNDYYLSQLSPVIGYASPNLDPNVDDIDAQDRAIDDDLDAGADEYFYSDIIFSNGFE